jgi:hypothetical protein
MRPGLGEALHSAFELQAGRTPSNVALIVDDTPLPCLPGETAIRRPSGSRSPPDGLLECHRCLARSVLRRDIARFDQPLTVEAHQLVDAAADAGRLRGPTATTAPTMVESS